MDDLARLGRLGALEIDEFFARNRAPGGWRGQQRFMALVQGGAEHYLRGQRGIWDLDIAVFFAQHPDLAIAPTCAELPASGTGVLRSSVVVRSTTPTSKAGQSTSCCGSSPKPASRSTAS